MMQVVKKKTRVQMQLDKIRPDIAKVVADLRRWEDKGIYLPGSGAWSLNLQGLVGLYRLDEGLGTVAKDNAPIEEPQDGAIVNGHWEEQRVCSNQIPGSCRAMAMLTAAAASSFSGDDTICCWLLV